MADFVSLTAFRPAGVTQQPFSINPSGEMRMVAPPTQKFLETWDSGTIDSINKWAATSGGGGVAPSASTGNCILSSGTTLNGFSKLTTNGVGAGGGVFKPASPGLLFQHESFGFVATGAFGHAFWGRGTSNASPTIASPAINAFGWEYTIAGALVPVVYASSTRVPAVFGAAKGLPTLLQPVSVPDLANHNYFTYFEGRRGYWCIDDIDNVVAQFLFGNGGPDVNGLPILFQSISNGAGTALAFNIAGLDVGDTADTSGALLLNNGFGYDEFQSNRDTNASLATLTAQGTGTVNSLDQLNVNGRGVQIGINITTLTAGTLTVTLQGKDIASGQYYTLLASTAIAATGFTLLTLYPGAVVTANASANNVLPRTWRVSCAVVTGPCTATIGASVIV